MGSQSHPPNFLLRQSATALQTFSCSILQPQSPPCTHGYFRPPVIHVAPKMGRSPCLSHSTGPMQCTVSKALHLSNTKNPALAPSVTPFTNWTPFHSLPSAPPHFLSLSGTASFQLGLSPYSSTFKRSSPPSSLLCQPGTSSKNLGTRERSSRFHSAQHSSQSKASTPSLNSKIETSS